MGTGAVLLERCHCLLVRARLLISYGEYRRACRVLCECRILLDESCSSREGRLFRSEHGRVHRTAETSPSTYWRLWLLGRVRSFGRCHGVVADPWYWRFSHTSRDSRRPPDSWRRPVARVFVDRSASVDRCLQSALRLVAGGASVWRTAFPRVGRRRRFRRTPEFAVWRQSLFQRRSETAFTWLRDLAHRPPGSHGAVSTRCLAECGQKLRPPARRGSRRCVAHHSLLSLRAPLVARRQGQSFLPERAGLAQRTRDPLCLRRQSLDRGTGRPVALQPAAPSSTRAYGAPAVLRFRRTGENARGDRRRAAVQRVQSPIGGHSRHGGAHGAHRLSSGSDGNRAYALAADDSRGTKPGSGREVSPAGVLGGP